MIDRRQVLVRGSGALAALNLGLAARYASAAETVHAPALLLVDSTLPGSEAVVDAARRANIPVAFFATDFGTAWLDHLEPLWRRRPVPIAGLTTAGTLFCAEHLARGHGFACSFKPAGLGQQDAPLLWALGPRGSKIMGWTRS
jgi:hypothetical protein